MPRVLSQDLRERVVAAVDGGMSCRRAAERFGVSAASAPQREPSNGRFPISKNPRRNTQSLFGNRYADDAPHLIIFVNNSRIMPLLNYIAKTNQSIAPDNLHTFRPFIFSFPIPGTCHSFINDFDFELVKIYVSRDQPLDLNAVRRLDAL